MKKSLSKSRKSYLIKVFSALLIAAACFALSYAENISGKTVITGDEMTVTEKGNKTVSEGNSKAVNKKNIIEADKLTYDKKRSMVTAEGNVKLFSKTDAGEPVTASGDFAEYYIDTAKGKLWGPKSDMHYYMKDSASPLVLYAENINLDKNVETLSAYDNVEVVTTSGTIYSDNAVFDKKTLSVVMVKDKKRPIADVLYDGRKGLYEADKMTFFNADDKKKIVMTGDVTAKIQMEDKTGIEGVDQQLGVDKKSGKKKKKQ